MKRRLRRKLVGFFKGDLGNIGGKSLLSTGAIITTGVAVSLLTKNAEAHNDVVSHDHNDPAHNQSDCHCHASHANHSSSGSYSSSGHSTYSFCHSNGHSSHTAHSSHASHSTGGEECHVDTDTGHTDTVSGI